MKKTDRERTTRGEKYECNDRKDISADSGYECHGELLYSGGNGAAVVIPQSAEAVFVFAVDSGCVSVDVSAGH